MWRRVETTSSLGRVLTVSSATTAIEAMQGRIQDFF